MNNPTQQQSPALRMEAGSINCILLYISWYAVNSQFIDHSESLTAVYMEYLLLLRLMLLIHLIRRTPIPIKRRPVGLVTKLASGNIESATSYTYDQKSNITQIADTIVNGRTQDFVYDAQNRLTQASGKYGVENYTYTDNGNLTKRGQFTLAYGDANHKHAVTAVTSPNTGTFNYAYDEAGNMVSRNGDTMSYNSQGKLKQIDTVGGDKLEYLYDSTGNRIRRKMKASGVVVYSFDGLYEITRTPGQAESHTLYFKGLYGDVFSQMTRSDAALITDASSGSKSTNSVDVATSTELLSFAKGDDFPPNSFVKGFFCEDIAGSCSQYYLKTAKYYYLQSAFRVVGIINTVEYDVFVWMMLVVVLYLVYIQSRRHRRDVARYVSTMIYAKRTLSVTPLLIVSILFTFTQCGLANGGGKKGEAPWILLASGINNDTPSVDEVPTTVNTVTPSSPNAPIGSIPPTGSGNNTNGSGGYRPSGSGGYTGGSGGSALVPVTGMYFLHPDHLGSITMITDGRGNVIAGGNNGGKSHISYKPYGEIHRTDSSGPDITRFKYTGQEEDKESGLLYYKARYYDPMVGRFLQADSVVMPQSTFGMNRYMYVEGNPVRFTDPSGHANVSHMFGQIVKHMAGGVQWASKGLQNAGKTYSNGVYGTHHNEKALTHGSAFANSVGRGLRIGFALCFPILSFIFDPAFTLGVWFTAANLIVGNVLGYGTSVHYAHGGYVIKNAPFVLPTAGITLGPFAFTGIGASKMTQQHEEGHIDQYNDWGGHEYMGRFGGSLFGQGSSWGENNADSRANTWAYDRDGLYYALALSAANKGDMSLLLAYLYWDKSSAWSKTY